MELTDEQITVLFTVLCNPMLTHMELHPIIEKSRDINGHGIISTLDYLVREGFLARTLNVSSFTIYAANISGTHLCSQGPTRSRLDKLLAK